MIMMLHGLVLFGIAVVVHLLLWQRRVPKKQMVALLKIFLVAFACWLPVALVSLNYEWGAFMMRFGHEVIHTSMFYWALALLYVEVYASIEYDSPTLAILLILYKAGRHGLTKAQIAVGVDMQYFFSSRVRGLLEDRLVVMSAQRCEITNKGRLILSIIVSWRRLLRLREPLG